MWFLSRSSDETQRNKKQHNETQRNTTQLNETMPPSPKDFFLGRAAVIQTTSNRALAGAHGNGAWPREKM